MKNSNLVLSKLDFVIVYLLEKAKEKGLKSLSKLQIMKLIYMLEIESYRYTGDGFFTGLKFVRDKNGPISVEIYNSLKKLQENNYISTTIEENTHYFPRHSISIKDGLSKNVVKIKDSEKIFLNSVFDDYLKLNQTQLKRIAYKTEPMLEILKKERHEKIELLKGLPINFDLVPMDEDIIDLIAN